MHNNLSLNAYHRVLAYYNATKAIAESVNNLRKFDPIFHYKIIFILCIIPSISQIQNAIGILHLLPWLAKLVVIGLHITYFIDKVLYNSAAGAGARSVCTL